ncbi:hypothetical protein CcCBS67573_g07315 [Chytriomyces confervae]|uniref:RING-type domain-containing protein n=1 Tax=Chytriomyces confervae TaxID=246404 RepID=A0A507EVT2_9FUNG|nr:hypothetical protein CcCBS67573_g07315 [Chytriomyces confervae]
MFASTSNQLDDATLRAIARKTAIYYGLDAVRSDMDPGDDVILNKALVIAAEVFSDVQPAHLRSVVLRSAVAVGVSDTSGVLLASVVVETLTASPPHPQRLTQGPLERSDLFRSAEYAFCARKLLYNEYPNHYKQTIKHVLLDANYSYTTAHRMLRDIPPPRLWSMLPSFLSAQRVRIPVPRIHPDIHEDIARMQREEFELSQCANDSELALELNRKEYTQLLECPVCINDVTMDDFCGIELKDIPLKESRQARLAASILKLLKSTEESFRNARDFRYSDQILVICILVTCELVMASFFISIPFGIFILLLVRLFFQVTGLWVQPMEMIIDLTGWNPALLERFRDGPISIMAVHIWDSYAKLKDWLLVLAPKDFAKDVRPVPFNCKNEACKIASCSDCGKEWTSCHVCHELERDSLRLYVEQAMTEAFIRTCPECHTRYTKQSGCNKMTCPTCKFIMCYICRQDISTVGYNHFCNHFRLIPGSTCTECDKCDLYATQEDESTLKKVAEEAEREWRRRHPGMVVGEKSGFAAASGLVKSGVVLEDKQLIQGKCQ